ncbi:STAS domain-containing protein [Streptomyces chrestomyceticus]|uniref:STAS domain-containing protein n=1 Tax=Streptomyces chrestomyceticus TaxID=68185 RepID=UPI0036B2DD3A
MSTRTPMPQGNCRTVRPAGELDLSTAPALRDLLRGNDAPPAARLITDLTGVTFMDNSGLVELETAQARCEAAGGWLRLVYHQPAIGRLLRLTALARRFPRYATVEDACDGRSAQCIAVRPAAAPAGTVAYADGCLSSAWSQAPAGRRGPAGCPPGPHVSGDRQEEWPKPA